MGGMRCREETRQTLLVARHLSLQDISVSWPYYITVILPEAGPGPTGSLWGFWCWKPLPMPRNSQLAHSEGDLQP